MDEALRQDLLSMQAEDQGVKRSGWPFPPADWDTPAPPPPAPPVHGPAADSYAEPTSNVPYMPCCAGPGTGHR